MKPRLVDRVAALIYASAEMNENDAFTLAVKILKLVKRYTNPFAAGV